MSAELGKLIQVTRERIGMTQDELGGRIGVSQQTIAKWEAGKSHPRPKALEKLVAALKIETSQLPQPQPKPPEGPLRFYHDNPQVVTARILDSPVLYSQEDGGERSSLLASLPDRFPAHPTFNQVASIVTLKKLLAPVVDAIDPSSRWDAVVQASSGNARVDYMNDELYAKFLHASNPIVLASILRTNIYRYLWQFLTFSLSAEIYRMYQVVIITLPEDQPLDFAPSENRRTHPVSNSRMLSRLTAEAWSHGIYIILARTPKQVASILTNPSRIDDPGWDFKGHVWDENPAD